MKCGKVEQLEQEDLRQEVCQEWEEACQVWVAWVEEQDHQVEVCQVECHRWVEEWVAQVECLEVCLEEWEAVVSSK